MTIEGTPCSTSVAEPAPIGEAALPVLAEIDPCHDPDGDRNDGGYSDDEDTADQRIGDPAASLPYRFGDVDQEMPVDPGDTCPDDIKENKQEWDHTGKSQHVDEDLEAGALAESCILHF